MNGLADLPASIREALAVHEAYRRLGIPPDCIFLARQNGADGAFLYVVAILIDCDFSTRVGPCEHSSDELGQTWKRAVALFNASSDAELSELWRSSSISTPAESVRLAARWCVALVAQAKRDKN